VGHSEYDPAAKDRRLWNVGRMLGAKRGGRAGGRGRGPGGSLMGTILDSTVQWTRAESARNLVAPGRWHQAELRHDGINECLVFLDGVQVGSGYGAPGPVRSVGPNGVAVGHWPEPPGIYGVTPSSAAAAT